jgi:hypothetical protein
MEVLQIQPTILVTIELNVFPYVTRVLAASYTPLIEGGTD